jgi:hypothetical protein
LAKQTRTILSFSIRPYKAIDSLVNPTVVPDEDRIEKIFRLVGSLGYGLPAFAGGVMFAADQDLDPRLPEWVAGWTSAMSYGRAIGGLLGGASGAYGWHRSSQRIFGERAGGTPETRLDALKERRFWEGCNALRYTLEGVAGIALLNRGSFLGWRRVWVKGVPGAIVLYQTVVRTWLRL